MCEFITSSCPCSSCCCCSILLRERRQTTPRCSQRVPHHQTSPHRLLQVLPARRTAHHLPQVLLKQERPQKAFRPQLGRPPRLLQRDPQSHLQRQEHLQAPLSHPLLKWVRCAPAEHPVVRCPVEGYVLSDPPVREVGRRCAAAFCRPRRTCVGHQRILGARRGTAPPRQHRAEPLSSLQRSTST